MQAIQRLGQFGLIVIEQFSNKHCSKTAAHLTYLTLFALVPMMTITYSMLTFIPAFDGVGDQIQGMLFQYILPENSLEIQAYLNEFSTQARKLSAAGVLFLTITSYMMLKNIEKAFNSVWGVLQGRRGLANFLLYWAVLSLGPILLGLGMIMSTYLLSLQVTVEEYDSLGLVPVLLKVLPFLLSTCAFTILFAAMPNTKVPVRHALAGGALTALTFEVLKALFGLLISKSSFTLIYGTFVIVPVFLFWINLSWMVVLAGAVFIRSLSTFKATVSGRSYPDLVAAMLVLWEFKRCLATGRSVDDSKLMKIGVDAEQWQRLRRKLVKHRVIAITQAGRYVLCRDLQGITLRQLADMVDMQSQMPGTCDYLQHFSWFPDMAGRLLAIDQFTEQQFDIPISELFASDNDDDYPDEGQGLEMLEEAVADDDTMNADTLAAPTHSATQVRGAITDAQWSSSGAEESSEYEAEPEHSTLVQAESELASDHVDDVEQDDNDDTDVDKGIAETGSNADSHSSSRK